MENIENKKEDKGSIQIVEQDKFIEINNCWEDDTLYFNFDKTESSNFIEQLDFPKELYAIYHKDKNRYEFIYMPLSEKYERTFKYVYCGKEFKLYYGEPSDRFQSLVRHYKRRESGEINDRILAFLRFDIYYESQDKGISTALFPTNFFIEGDFDKMDYAQHITFFKHVNFMLTYYDRKSPVILFIDNTDGDIEDIALPCKTSLEPFPEKINSCQFDSTLLELMMAAQNTGSYRLKYIFYFQVLEYCSYYYIENELRLKISNIIKSPDILNAEKYSGKIIEAYSSYFKGNNDSARLERLLIDLCSYENIKDELKTNSKYFTNDLSFDGGFTIKALFKSADDIDKPNNLNNTISQIRKNIEAIRNVLVHARESRENVEIKPTQRNSRLLIPYLYLLRRIAEVVILRYE